MIMKITGIILSSINGAIFTSLVFYIYYLDALETNNCRKNSVECTKSIGEKE